MSLETDFYAHQASCDQRYKNIEEKLESGKARMTRIEFVTPAVSEVIIDAPAETSVGTATTSTS